MGSTLFSKCFRIYSFFVLLLTHFSNQGSIFDQYFFLPKRGPATIYNVFGVKLIVFMALIICFQQYLGSAYVLLSFVIIFVVQ